jgi:hypothetical protein
VYGDHDKERDGLEGLDSLELFEGKDCLELREGLDCFEGLEGPPEEFSVKKVGNPFLS